jgi:hypothetical protein
MNALSPFLSVNRSCDETLQWLSQRLSRAGLRLLQTFDLHDVRYAITDCGCPHHGTDQCDCQMVVLLIYGEAIEPATLILHGNDGQTSLSLVNTPLQHADPSLLASIEQALQITPTNKLLSLK